MPEKWGDIFIYHESWEFPKILSGNWGSQPHTSKNMRVTVFEYLILNSRGFYDFKSHFFALVSVSIEKKYQ